MKKVMIIPLLFLLSLSYAFSQSSQLRISHVIKSGSNDIYLIISNVGTKPLSGIKVYIDEKEMRTISSLGPKIALKLHFRLSEGDHLIEVKSLEGAYDSIRVNIGETTTTIFQEREIELSEKEIFILIGFIVIIFLGIFVGKIIKLKK